MAGAPLSADKGGTASHGSVAAIRAMASVLRLAYGMPAAYANPDEMPMGQSPFDPKVTLDASRCKVDPQ
jgi:hypothetical protein